MTYFINALKLTMINKVVFKDFLTKTKMTEEDVMQVLNQDISKSKLSTRCKMYRALEIACTVNSIFPEFNVEKHREQIRMFAEIVKNNYSKISLDYTPERIRRIVLRTNEYLKSGAITPMCATVYCALYEMAGSPSIQGSLALTSGHDWEILMIKELNDE